MADANQQPGPSFGIPVYNTPPPVNSPVVETMERHNAVVKRLDGAIEKLATRIQAVLAPQAPTASAPKAVDLNRGGSSLVVELRAQTERLGDMAEWVESLARDVEL